MWHFATLLHCDLWSVRYEFPIKCSNPMLAGTPNFWQIASKLCQKTVQGPPTTIFVTITYFTYTMSRIILILCKFGLTMTKKQKLKERNMKQIYFIVFSPTLCSFSFPKCQQQFGSSLWYCQNSKYTFKSVHYPYLTKARVNGKGETCFRIDLGSEDCQMYLHLLAVFAKHLEQNLRRRQNWK